MSSELETLIKISSLLFVSVQLVLFQPCEEGLVVKNAKNEEKLIQADTVVLAVGLSPVNALYHSLINKFPEVYDIGDCQEPRNIMAAIWNGYELGRSL